MYFYVAFLSVPDYEDDQRQLEAVFVKAAKVVRDWTVFVVLEFWQTQIQKSWQTSREQYLKGLVYGKVKELCLKCYSLDTAE